MRFAVQNVQYEMMRALQEFTRCAVGPTDFIYDVVYGTDFKIVHVVL